MIKNITSIAFEVIFFVKLNYKQIICVLSQTKLKHELWVSLRESARVERKQSNCLSIN